MIMLCLYYGKTKNLSQKSSGFNWLFSDLSSTNKVGYYIKKTEAATKTVLVVYLSLCIMHVSVVSFRNFIKVLGSRGD